jgi:hypothetical protein
MVWLLGCFFSFAPESHHLGSMGCLSPFVKRELLQPLLLKSSFIHPSPSILDLPISKSASHCVRLEAYWITSNGGVSVKQGYRLIIVDKAGVLVSEFQLTENALAQPEAFVAALKQSIDDIEEEEP